MRSKMAWGQSLSNVSLNFLEFLSMPIIVDAP